MFNVESYISTANLISAGPPPHLPAEIEAAFKEGATCASMACWNAAAAMFRLCIDLATEPLLPADDAPGLNKKIRRDLGLRLKWLFEQRLLPDALRELSICIREDGNDGAHHGTLTEADAHDLLDFTTVLLERMFTEPERLKLAKQRREERRSQKPN